MRLRESILCGLRRLGRHWLVTSLNLNKEGPHDRPSRWHKSLGKGDPFLVMRAHKTAGALLGCLIPIKMQADVHANSRGRQPIVRVLQVQSKVRQPSFTYLFEIS
jgi:hypothetical protein